MPRTELLLLIGEIREGKVALNTIQQMYVAYHPAFIDE